MDDYCKNYSVALYATDSEQDRLLFSRARCGMWSCEYCASVNRKQWFKRMAEGLKAIGDVDGWAFWTLTHDLDNAPYIEQRRTLSNAWNKLIGHIKYRSDHEIYYIRAIEIGARATRRMHMHVLINFVPDDIVRIDRVDGTHYHKSEFWFSRAEKTGFGRIADITDVSGTYTYKEPEIALGSDLETTRAVLTASYIAKYMTKTDADTESRFPPRTRRFNTSRNFPKLADEEGFTRHEWSRGEKMNEGIASNAWRHKMHVYDLQREENITIDNFDDSGQYID